MIVAPSAPTSTSSDVAAAAAAAEPSSDGDKGPKNEASKERVASVLTTRATAPHRNADYCTRRYIIRRSADHSACAAAARVAVKNSATAAAAGDNEHVNAIDVHRHNPRS